MCGRYYLTSPAIEIAQHFQVELPEISARYNIAPTQPVLGIRAPSATSVREACVLQWGLVPSWAKDPSIGNRMINARAETAAEKPCYRNALNYRRCLLPANGFFEWQQQGSKKQPHAIGMADGEPFGMAGLWERWETVDGLLETCAILTTEPNELLQTIHDRMPVIVGADDYGLWLDPTIQDPARIRHLLAPFPARLMTARPIGTRVNNAAFDDPLVLAAA